MPPKRKRATLAAPAAAEGTIEIPLPSNVRDLTGGARTQRIPRPTKGLATNGDILDGRDALRDSPDGEVNEAIAPGPIKEEDAESELSDAPDVVVEPPSKKPRKGGKKAVTNGVKAEEAEDVKPAAVAAKKKAATNGEAAGDPEAEGDEEAPNEDEVKEALSRPPPVNSNYLPLPWKGRLGYACLNTYLRTCTPPVFSSRTCRIASILEHRHPLKDPSQPEHATKNRPDKDLPASVERGQRWVEEIGLANARDIVKMVKWNDKFGIRFMRLSSEMFPFASHEEYGYTLAPFAAETLAAAGKVVAELGHRVTTHPGQFTQLGSPRKPVIENAVRDLVYHDEMLSLLKLPPQQDRDAIMVLHMGGAFGDKAATLDRFRENYAKLPISVKNRLVLENDDVVWHVHDLLPVCEELNIPFVLDFHHHNIVFDPAEIREGTEDIQKLFPRILATWTRKNKTPKMHYSEPTPPAITGRQRRKHSPRVMTLPPCPDTMDLMIEAKDKEQAVFELMRTFKLPGFARFNDITPHIRLDDQRALPKPKAKSKSKKKKAAEEEDEDEDAEAPVREIPEEELGMGGPEGRVYWPPGMEEWLRPPKRVVKPKEDPEVKKLKGSEKMKALRAAEAAAAPAVAGEADGAEKEQATPKKGGKAAKGKGKGKGKSAVEQAIDDAVADEVNGGAEEDGKVNGTTPASKGRKGKAAAKKVVVEEAAPPPVKKGGRARRGQ